jgi:hypothetical protein
MKISKKEIKERDELIFNLFFKEKLNKKIISLNLKISVRTVNRYLQKYPKNSKKVLTYMSHMRE